eukprot:3920594-Prymnesium_polylepis.1
MIAWLSSPGRSPPPASTSCWARRHASLPSALNAPSLTCAEMPHSRHSTRSTLPSTTGALTPNAIDATAPAV